jgi:thiosulfate/3-mercaptopyruvate sulfurtransferase
MPATAHPPFIDADTVRADLDGFVLVEMRWSLDGSQGREQYLAGHLPGAVFVDLDTVAAGPPTARAGRHPLPDPARFAADLGALGIAEQDRIVVADQGPGAIAARLVWMLRVIGGDAAVLDGGVAGWDGALDSGEVVRAPVTRRVHPWPADRLADADLVARLAADDRAVVLDARDRPRYLGEAEPTSSPPGRVPGARSAPFVDNLDAGHLAPLERLRATYAAVQALDATDVVAYCGSGVTACHDLLVLEALGVSGRLYPGSWSAWSADPDRAVASGPDDPGSGDTVAGSTGADGTGATC